MKFDWKGLFGFKKSAPESDIENSAIVTWPVAYSGPHAPVDPHITILYVPYINRYDKKDFIDAIRKTNWEVMIPVTVSGLEMFGEDYDIPVLRVEHSFLEEYRDSLKKRLRDYFAIVVPETFPDYKPHVTITDDALKAGGLPTTFMAGPVELWWGEEKIKING